MSPGQVKRELAALRSLSTEMDRAARSVNRILRPGNVSERVEELAQQGGMSREFLIQMCQALKWLSQLTQLLAKDPNLYRAMSSLPLDKRRNKTLPETRIL